MKRKFLPLIAIFLASMAIGFFAEKESSKCGPVLVRKQALEIAGRVIESVKSLLREGALRRNDFCFSDFAPASSSKSNTALSAEIMQGFPDGTFRPFQPLTRGEGIDLLARLQTFIENNLLVKQGWVEKKPRFEDIPESHWLSSPLKKLAGIGALSVFQGYRLSPDSFFLEKEAEEIAATISDYFKSDLLVFEVLPEGIQIFSKGTFSPIPTKTWRYSWNRKPWEVLTENGFLPFSKNEETDSSRRLLLTNESFQPVGIPWLSVEPGTLWFVKLQRKALGVQEFFVHPPPEAEEKVTNKQPEIVKRNFQSLPTSRREDISLWERERWESPNEEGKAFAAEESTSKEHPASQVTPLYSEGKELSEFSQNSNSEVDVEAQESKAVSNVGSSAEFEGIVIDSSTKKVIPGACVLVEEQNLTTDLQGKFVFRKPRELSSKITAFCEGFEPCTIRINLSSIKIPLVLQLTPKLATLEGVVEDEKTGKPIPGAHLKIAEKEMNSDYLGRFSIPGLHPTFHQIDCSAPGYMGQVQIEFIQFPRTKTTIKLPPLIDRDNYTWDARRHLRRRSNNPNWQPEDYRDRPESPTNIFLGAGSERLN